MKEIKENILAATKWRRAIKKYNGQDIDRKDWDFLLEIARLAPTSLGLEDWKILEINNKNLLNQLVDEGILWGAKDKIDGMSKFIMFTVNKSLLKKENLEKKYKNRNIKVEDINKKIDRIYNFIENDFNILTEREIVDWLGKQVYIVMAQMIFAASMIEIDSTPVEGFNKNKLNEKLANNNILNLNEEEVVLCAIFGYRDEKLQIVKKNRRKLNEILRIIG